MHYLLKTMWLLVKKNWKPQWGLKLIIFRLTASHVNQLSEPSMSHNLKSQILYDWYYALKGGQPLRQFLAIWVWHAVPVIILQLMIAYFLFGGNTWINLRKTIILLSLLFQNLKYCVGRFRKRKLQNFHCLNLVYITKRLYIFHIHLSSITNFLICVVW